MTVEGVERVVEVVLSTVVGDRTVVVDVVTLTFKVVGTGVIVVADVVVDVDVVIVVVIFVVADVVSVVVSMVADDLPTIPAVRFSL